MQVREISPDHVAQLRHFNQLAAQRTGALDKHVLGRERPLGESRLLFEVGTAGAELRELRARLALDSGYLSRLLKSLSVAGLVQLGESTDDGRVRRVTLTPTGLVELYEMNRRANEAAKSTLEPLTPPQRQRLVHSMAEVCRLLLAGRTHIERVDPAGMGARQSVARYLAELAERFGDGFVPERHSPVGDAELSSPNGVFLLAYLDGEAIACGGVKCVTPGVGLLKRMWVSPSVRGLGFGRRMLLALELEARELGITTLRLETNSALREAIRLYESAGYTEVASFDNDDHADHWFEKRLP